MKKVALTFDDGPHSRYTLRILDILKGHKVKACFFLLGKNVEYYPEIARRIKREGHLIGNHTYSHRHLRRLKPENILRQIEKAEKVYKNILNLKPKFFRPPYGEYNKTVENLARERGYKLVGWEVCANDWESPPPELIAERTTSQVSDGSIVLLHDGANLRHGESRINTVRALPKIIKVLRAKGFKLVRLDRLWPR